MYRCPRCHVELSADARYCKNCGFNKTNARLAATQLSPLGVQQQVPPQNQQGEQQTPTRTIQPQHKHVLPQPDTYGQQAQNAQSPQMNRPTTPPIQQARTAIPNNTQQVSPGPQQGNVPQRGNGFQQPPQQNPQNIRPVTTPPQGPIFRMPMLPSTPPEQAVQRPNNQWIPEQVVRTSTPPLRQYAAPSPNAFEPLQWGLGALPDTPVSVESIQATSKAAEHWRQSWLDRQHAEAGPAVGVSRGQASVPEPLLQMQNSLARMRAIIFPRSAVDGKGSRVRFWLPVILLLCLIGGLGTYVLSTLSAGFSSSSSASASAVPTFTLKNVKTKTLTAGQAVQVHGEHFGANDTISFYLDTIGLMSTNGKPATVQSDNKGAFDALLSIPNTQLSGEYPLQARDDATGQHASIPVQTKAATTTNVAQLSVPGLTFASVVGQNNPGNQTVNITNTSNGTISWSATGITDDQTEWLSVANTTTSGQLGAGQTATIQVGVNTQGLKSSPAGHPYTGAIDFTILNQGQVLLPVKLTLTQTNVDVLVSPNPLIATQSLTTPGQCQANTSLTLINLDNTPVNWNARANTPLITLDGKVQENGRLAAAGSANDTHVIKIGCNGVQLDTPYTITVFYNGSQQDVPVSVVKG